MERLCVARTVLTFHDIPHKEIKGGARLNASLGDEFVHIIDPNEDIQEYMDRQRQALLDRIGLDLSTSEARKAQYHPEDPTRRLISKGDVDSGVPYTLRICEG